MHPHGFSSSTSTKLYSLYRSRYYTIACSSVFFDEDMLTPRLIQMHKFALRCTFLLLAEIYILMLYAGLYIGSMGPHSAEVVQLQRKYGNWQTNDTFSINQELQCFEYVEAVKLTGDVNVPAGQVLNLLDLQHLSQAWLNLKQG